jgi:hypothetical protein
MSGSTAPHKLGQIAVIEGPYEERKQKRQEKNEVAACADFGRVNQ